MTRDDRDRKQLTRRGFIRQSGTLSAGVALGPIVLDLSACSSPQPSTADAATSANAPASTTTGTANATGSTAQAAAGSGTTKPVTPAVVDSGGAAGGAPATAQASGG